VTARGRTVPVTGRAPRVLLCARDNAERALIASALTGRGATIEVFDPTAFPGRAPLGLTVSGPAPGSADGAAATGVPADHGGIDAVWSRFVVGTGLPEMAPGDRETCVAAAEMLLTGWLESLDAYQLDPQWIRRRADNKPDQLRHARAVGLDVPPTLVTNDAAAVRAFAAAHGPIVAKMLVQPVGAGPTDEADVVFTTALGDDELADLAGLDLCPMIFQARVPNDADVRATVIGDRVVAAVYEARADGPDWRRDSYARDETPTWTRYELPDDVAAGLVALARRLGLGYGAADLVRRPDGTHAFIEMNAEGAFAFLGEPVAASVADAVAELLTCTGGRP
jgi:hypothetical protein